MQTSPCSLEPLLKSALYQGTTLVVPQKQQKRSWALAPEGKPEVPSFRLFASEKVAYLALLLLLLASPALLLAQFQKPNDEELRMTSDPKAPGAAAVYLNIERPTTIRSI
jgi:hypothetical protein